MYKKASVFSTGKTDAFEVVDLFFCSNFDKLNVVFKVAKNISKNVQMFLTNKNECSIIRTGVRKDKFYSGGQRKWQIMIN